MADLICVNDVFYTYPDGTHALNGVSFSLRSGCRVGLIGTNGSGKSTLLGQLAGCYKPSNGEISVEGQVMTQDQLKRTCGLVFQDPDDQLFMAEVIEDVAFGLIAQGLSVDQAHQKADHMLHQLGIERLTHRPPHRLSGGEKRMVALAGALVMNPKVLLFDEPSSALDTRARRRLIDHMKELTTPFLMTTHDFDMARQLCDQIFVMHKGQMVAQTDISILSDQHQLAQWNLEP